MRSLVVAAVVTLASPAYAHFKLNAPASMFQQDGTGNPLYDSPCSQVSGVATGAVTNFSTGETITIEIDETISHPGHYRVALAADLASLPADPVVTPGSTACGTAAIQSPPQLPILADGALVHTSMFNPTTQSIQVTLPGTECPNCVLQVIEFTSNHSSPCFHYHCAIVNVTTPSTPTDAGVDGNGMMMNDDAAVGPDGGGGGNDDGGTGSAALTNPYANQGCSTSGGSPGVVAFLLAALLWHRKRNGR